MSDSLRPRELQHARLPYPSLSPGICSNSVSIESVMPSNHLILCHPLLLYDFILPQLPPKGLLLNMVSVSTYKFCCCSVTKSCLTLWPHGLKASLSFTISQSLLKLMSIESVMPSNHPLLSPSPPALNLSQHQGLFQWVSSLNPVAKAVELQHQSFQWIFKVDFL